MLSWRNLDFVVSAACKGLLGVAGIRKWTGREARALREALRMSGREFAGRLGMSGRAISKWEPPTKPTLPRADSQAMLDTMLANATEEQRARFERFLADDPRESAGVIMQQVFPANGSAHAGTLDVDDMERRELLKIMGGAALAAPLSGHADADTLRRELDTALNALTTESDVKEWERVAARYSVESGLVPPALLLPELLADLDEAVRRLKCSPESLHAPMARVCGQLGALTAQNFFNDGDERSALRYWRTALRIMDYSGDRAAQADLYGFRAVCALYERQSSPSAALEFAGDAIGIAGNTACAGAASGYAARAMALALLGDHRESTRTLQDLNDAFSRIPAAATTARAAFGYSEQQLRYVESHVYAHAGRISDAARSQDAGLALVPDGAFLVICSFELYRAMCLITSGDPSEGARHVVRALQSLPSGYRQVSTVRWTAARALGAAPVGAANARAIAEARELLSLQQST